MSTTPPGWYHADGDPPATHRYWDGSQWTTEPQPVAPPQATPAQQPPAQFAPSTPASEAANAVDVDSGADRAEPADQAGSEPPLVDAAVQEPPAGQFGERAPVEMTSHEVDYEIFGDDMQFVEIELDSGETVIGEAGSMMHMEDGISFEAVMGDGTKPEQGFFGKMKDAGKRAVSGEALFLTHFTHQGEGKARVSFAAPYPGKIMPIDLDDVGNRLICQKDAFLCAAKGTRVGVAFNRKLGAGVFGGEGFILQELQGDGMVFVQAGGTVVERRLENETLRVDTGCLVALESHIDYDIQRSGNLKSMMFGGEGIFLATLRGTGRVWIQSLPFSRLADRLVATAALDRGQSGESSVLGGVSSIFER